MKSCPAAVQCKGAEDRNHRQEKAKENAPVVDRVGDDLEQAVCETERTFHGLNVTDPLIIGGDASNAREQVSG